MSYYVVDVETDGAIPPKYSMVCFGVVKLTPELDTTFYGKTRPISDLWIPEALAVSGFSREEHQQFDEPEKVMKEFVDWIESTTKGRPVFISDNNGFDFAWISYYMWMFVGRNPFGWSSRRIGDIYCGMKMDMFVKWKWLRDHDKYPHNHHPLSDALSNASAILKMQEMGLKMRLK